MSTMSGCQCTDWLDNIGRLDGPIITAAMRTGGKGYEGVQFRYCPWCGRTLEPQPEPPTQPQVSGARRGL